MFHSRVLQLISFPLGIVTLMHEMKIKWYKESLPPLRAFITASTLHTDFNTVSVFVLQRNTSKSYSFWVVLSKIGFSSNQSFGFGGKVRG